MKLDALLFLRSCVERHRPAGVTVQPLLLRSGAPGSCNESLLHAVAALVADDWYKVVAEALRVLEAVVGAVADHPGPDRPAPYDQVVSTVFEAVNKRLDTVDIDQEIKDCAISAVGKVRSPLITLTQPNLTYLPTYASQLVSCFGDSPALQGRLPQLFALLQRRLENETTRSAALKALTAIACSTHSSEKGLWNPIQP